MASPSSDALPLWNRHPISKISYGEKNADYLSNTFYAYIFFLFFIYSFTMLCWFLPYNNANQSKLHIPSFCSLLPLPTLATSTFLEMQVPRPCWNFSELQFSNVSPRNQCLRRFPDDLYAHENPNDTTRTEIYFFARSASAYSYSSNIPASGNPFSGYRAGLGCSFNSKKYIRPRPSQLEPRSTWNLLQVISGVGWGGYIQGIPPAPASASLL